MKKSVLILSLTVLIFLAILGLSACDATDVLPLGEVQLALSDKGVSFSFDGTTTFQYSSDGGALVTLTPDTTEISFSATEGTHTIVLNALDPDTSKVIATASYTYRTVPAVLDPIRVSGMTASWTAVGKVIELKVDDADFVPYTESSYTAQDTVRITVRVTSGFDAENNVFYLGSAKSPKKAVVLTRSATISASYNALSAPVISVKDDHLVWNSVDNAVSYEIKTDNGEYRTADKGAFSAESGDHTFYVKAIGDGESHKDSEPATFRYKTAATSLVASKTAADAVSFSYTGIALARKVPSDVSDGVVASDEGQEGITPYMYKSGFAYYKVDPDSFRPWTSGAVTFAATAGYDAAHSVYYPTESVEEVSFTLPAYDPIGLSVLADWRAPAGSVAEAGQKYDGTPSIAFEYGRDGADHVYSHALALTDGYDLITFDAKGDSLASVTLRFADEANNCELTYSLGVLPAYWQRFSLSVTDKGWRMDESLSLNEVGEIILVDPTLVPERYRSVRSMTEFIACFDTFEILLSAASPEPLGRVEFAAIELSYSEGAESSVSQPLYHHGTAYLFSEIVNEEANDIFLSFDEESFILYSTALEENFYVTGDASFDEAAATLRLGSEGFALTLLFTYNGYYLIGDVGEGKVAEYLNGKTFRLAADLTLTFEDGRAGEAYVSDAWTSYYKSPTSGEYLPSQISDMIFTEKPAPQETDDDLSGGEEHHGEDALLDGEEEVDAAETEDNEAEDAVEDGGEDIANDEDATAEDEPVPVVLSLRTAYAQINRFVYNERGRSLGIANAFSMTVCTANALQIKVAALSTDGTAYYLLGTASAFETLGATDGFTTLTTPIFAEPIELRSFYVEINNPDVRDVAELLVSEFRVSYQAVVSATSRYPAPVITALEDRLEFSYDIPNAAFEYKLDASKDFTDGERGDFFAVSSDVGVGTHTLYVRALIGEEEAPSKTEKYEFTVEAVTVSAISVKIGEYGDHAASWKTNGICYLQVTKAGEREEEEIVVEEFHKVTDFSYLAARDVTLTVKAEGYYDATNKVYYVGTVLAEKKIRVGNTLATPELTYAVVDGVEGIAWAPVQDADRYSVQVNDAEVHEQKECFFPFESEGNEYEIKVISIDEDGIAYSNAASFTYRVVPISAGRMSRTGQTFVGKVVGLRAFVSEKNKAEAELPLDPYDQDGSRAYRYTVSGEGLHVVTVRVTAGYDESVSVLYVGSDVSVKNSLPITRIDPPVVRPNATEGENVTGLTWKRDGDFLHGETAFRLEERVGDGEWTLVRESMTTEYLFPTVEGEYAIRVSAIGDGVEYLNSAFTEYAFSVRTLTLAPSHELSEDETTRTLTVGAVALGTKIEENNSGDPALYTLPSKQYTVTTKVSLTAYGGYDGHTYYAGSTQSWTDTLIVPVPLAAPEPNSTGNGVFWTNVKHADYYEVTLEKYDDDTSAYVAIHDRETVEVVFGKSEYSFPFEKENKQFVTGKYRLTVLACSRNAEQYPNKDASAVFEYEVRDVTIGEVTKKGNTASWTYEAWRLSLYVNGALFDDSYDQASYTNTSGTNCTVALTAAEGYDAENHVRYIGSASTLDTPFLLDYSQLLTPVLTPTDTALEWEEITAANKYEVRVTKDGVEESVTDYDGYTYTFPSVAGSYKVSVSAVDRIGSFDPSDPAVFTFEVREVSLSAIAEEVTGKISRKAYWTKVGKMTISTDGKTYGPTTEITEYSPEVTTHYYVKCSPGFVSSGENRGIYYFGEERNEDYLLVIPKFLEAPTLTLTASGISVSGVDPLAKKLQVSHDGVLSEIAVTDPLIPNSVLLIPNSVTAGAHTLTVTAYHPDETQYPADDASRTVTYTVKDVSLSMPDAEYVVDELNFTANGIVTVSEEGTLDRTYAVTDSYVYKPSDTVTVTVTASRGLDAEHDCYYVGEEDLTSESMEVIIPIPLRAPTLTKAKDYITVVSEVVHAEGYEVRYTSDGGETWSDWSKTLVSERKIVYGDLLTEVGSCLVEVRAYSDPVRYPIVDTSVSSVSYSVESVSLSALTQTENVVSWTATACEVQRKVDIVTSTSSTSGSYTVVSDSSYTCAEAGTYAVYVRARRGYKASADTYYHAGSVTVEAESVSLTIRKLSAPTVSGSIDGISWTAVTDAKGYKVRVNNGAYETVGGTTKAFSTTQGTYKVEVIAVGDDKMWLSSAAGSYTYTVKSVTLSAVSVSGRKASWSATALKTFCKLDKGSYSEITDTSYSLPSDKGAGTYTVTVKAEGGFSNDTYYYCASPIEKEGKITLTKLPSPTLGASSKGISWSKISNASSYASKTDSESYAGNTALNVAFSSSTGKHTVYVKAIASASTAYVDSDAATFTYTTKKPSLTFLLQSNTEVTFSYDGIKAQYSTDNGSTWSDSVYPGYTATTTSTVKFRATGGYVAEDKVYYNGNSSTVSKSFTVSGQLIDNFESGSGSGWSKTKYVNNDWKSANEVSLDVISDSAGGGSAMKFTSFANGVAYKITKNMKMNSTYYAIEFDIRVNRSYPTVDTILQVDDADTGIYIQYRLTNLSAIKASDDWYHVVVSFNDDNLDIWAKGEPHTTATIQKYISQTSYKTWENAIKSMDTLSFIVKGSSGNGAAVSTYIDNIRLVSSGSSSATKLTTARTNLEFGDGTAGASYTNGKWKKYEWTNNAYQASSKDILQCHSDGNTYTNNLVLGMYCGYNAYKFTYNEGGSNLGTANHLSIDLASWTSGANINYRIILIDSNNNEIFLAGSATRYATLTPTDKPAMRSLSFNFAETTIKSIVIIAQCGANANLFADNIYLSKSSVS